jgi:hypothetical protein
MAMSENFIWPIPLGMFEPEPSFFELKINL